MLSSFLPGPDISAYRKIKNVILADASVIRQDGKKQEQKAAAKAMFATWLLGGKILELPE